MNLPDAKTAVEGVGLLKKIADWDLTGRRAEVSRLQASVNETELKLHESEQKLSARQAEDCGLSTQELAVISISAVAIVAIIAIVVVVAQRGVVQV